MELLLQDGQRAARLSCPANLTPSAGQYLLAGTSSDLLLPDPVYYADSAPEGFLAAPAPESWMPGLDLYLRGPLGHGFNLPASARKVALVAFDGSAARLRPLIPLALNQGAAVVVTGTSSLDQLPNDVEVQPLSALSEIAAWADWLALEVARENAGELRERLGNKIRSSVWADAQALIRTPVPCGGIAECGVCAVTTKTGWKMACREGPVFRWDEI
jgi:hypothetical protein